MIDQDIAAKGLYWDEDEDGGLFEAIPIVLDSEPAPVAKELPAPPPLPEAEAGGSRLAQVRTYFPETWLWNLERTGYVIIIYLYIYLCFINI